MDALSSSGSSSSSSSGYAPAQHRPKSPPEGFDLYGKRRQLIKVQILEREIGLLQEELKSIDDLQPASKCCKELHDFIGAKTDPLMVRKQETDKSNLGWKKLCCPRICCFNGCGPNCKMPKCCGCQLQLCSCTEKKGCENCCKCKCRVSCPNMGCFNSCLRNCTKMKHCCSCSKACFRSCCV